MEEIPFVFDAFHQHKSSSTEHGLGLAAVRAIVEEHGRRVGVETALTKKQFLLYAFPKCAN